MRRYGLLAVLLMIATGSQASSYFECASETVRYLDDSGGLADKDRWGWSGHPFGFRFDPETGRFWTGSVEFHLTVLEAPDAPAKLTAMRTKTGEDQVWNDFLVINLTEKHPFIYFKADENMLATGLCNTVNT